MLPLPPPSPRIGSCLGTRVAKDPCGPVPIRGYVASNIGQMRGGIINPPLYVRQVGRYLYLVHIYLCICLFATGRRCLFPPDEGGGILSKCRVKIGKGTRCHSRPWVLQKCMMSILDNSTWCHDDIIKSKSNPNPADSRPVNDASLVASIITQVFLASMRPAQCEAGHPQEVCLPRNKMTNSDDRSRITPRDGLPPCEPLLYHGSQATRAQRSR